MLLERHASAVCYSNNCGEWCSGVGITGIDGLKSVAYGLELYFLLFSVISVNVHLLVETLVYL